MSNNVNRAKAAQIKSRRTRLRKLSNEELIAIILRKDANERKNVKKIKLLTEGNVTLTHELESHKDDGEKIKEQSLTITSLNEDVKNLTNQVGYLSDNYMKAEKLAMRFKKTTYALVVVSTILFAGVIFLL